MSSLKKWSPGVSVLNFEGVQGPTFELWKGPGVPRLGVLVSLLNHTKSFPSFAIFLFSGKVYIRDVSQNIWFNCLNKLRQLNQIFWEISRKNCNKTQSFQNRSRNFWNSCEGVYFQKFCRPATLPKMNFHR